jgi:curved DNA-binding protein CbpA
VTAEADYYEVLGVPRDADGEAIRRAFEAAARDVRPDGSAAPDADERFRQLAEAYSVLSNPGPRMLYDRFGYRGSGSGLDEALSDAGDPVTREETTPASRSPCARTRPSAAPL